MIARSWSLLLMLGAAGCVSGEYNQVTFNEPVDMEQLHALQPGRDGLQACLDALGAPVVVREYRVGDDRRSGLALAWFWSSAYGWGLTISSNVSDEASASFEMDFDNTDTPGCVLWFDENLVLERWREGRVGQLLPPRRRPSPAVDG